MGYHFDGNEERGCRSDGQLQGGGYFVFRELDCSEASQNYGYQTFGKWQKIGMLSIGGSGFQDAPPSEAGKAGGEPAR